MENLKEKIVKEKEAKNAVILAHNYQPDSIQEIADYVGDSFGLSQKAAALEVETIVFAGVYFMAESAKILSPEKNVLIPDRFAGCPMAEMADLETLEKMKAEYPEAEVVSYVNSSAEIKAASDICCTSSNAVKIVNSLAAEKIIFLPDKNLGSYVAQQTDKEIIFWEGYCPTHHRVMSVDVKRMRKQYPQALLAVHPECRKEVVEAADFAGSTAGILKFAKESKAQEIIVGTELGLLYRLKAENPAKKFRLLSPKLICQNMKRNSLKKIYKALKNMETAVELKEEVRVKAAEALNKMLAYA